jgi:hypothetical protein
MRWSTLNAGCNEPLGVHDVFDGWSFLSQRRQGAEAQSFFERNNSELDGACPSVAKEPENRRVECHLEPKLPPDNSPDQKTWNAGSPKYPKANDISNAALWWFKNSEV